MIEKLEIKEFDTVYAIMERSFPLEEYRSYEDQKALFKKPAYRIYAAKENGKILGFAAVWQLENGLFLEHLAVDPQCRNRGIGAKLLGFLAQNRCCLEVELPETDIARRRIGFYERNGFFFNDYPYLQPPLRKGNELLPLRLMTKPTAIDEATYERYKKRMYAVVYKYEG